LKANEHIIIVEVDDASIKEFGSFPFDRLVYAQVLDNLKPFQTAVVAFDLLFLDPSPRPESDKIFASKIAKYPNVVLGSSLTNHGKVQIPSSLFKQKSYET